MHCPTIRQFMLYLYLTTLGINTALADETYFNGNVAVTQQEYQASVLVNQGVSLLRENQNSQAVETLSQAIKLGPKLYQAHYNLGIALAKVNQFDNAANELKEAINLNPNFSSSWLCLGGVFQSSGHLNECINTYKEFLKRFPEDRSCDQVKKLLTGIESQSLIQAKEANTNNQSNYLNEIPLNDRNTWPKALMPLKVFIANGQSINGYQDFFKPTLIEAFQDYQEVSKGKIKFVFTDNINEANIICNWIDDVDKFKDGAEAGNTQITRNNTGIIKATIDLLTLSINNTPALSKNRLHAICLHEIGHAIGIGGHSTNPEDIMYFSTPLTDQHKELSQRDINTINLLYQNN